MRFHRSACIVIALLTSCGPSARPEVGDDGPDGPCPEGIRRCEGNTFEVCSKGEWIILEQCPLFCSLDGCASCEGPGCVPDLCAQATADKSYIGCEYWAVDLDNATEVQGLPIPVAGDECGLYPETELVMGQKICFDGASGSAGKCDAPNDACPPGYTCMVPPAGVCGLFGDTAPFAIVVSNPQAMPVAVTITVASGQSMSVPVQPGNVEALYPQQLGFADASIDGSGISTSAYRITSSAPIVAYQFNPLNDVDVFSNDASLLIPRSGFDKKYMAVSYKTLTRRGPAGPGRDDYNGYFSVVAWEPDTEITVTPTATTVAGRDGTPAIAAGQTHTFTLQPYQVLNLEAVRGPDQNSDEGLNGGDLTGSTIQSANGKTFGVFGGHEAVRISAPNSNCCADHLEEMLFPTSTWGKEFVVARTFVRRDAPDILRVVANVAGTTVTFSPPPVAGSCPVLSSGGHCDVQIAQPTTVIATQPVTVAHLMMSAILNLDGTGDPSLGIVPPVEQHRTDYKFLAPMDYAEQFVTIVGVAGDQVMLDGIPINLATVFGAGRAAATIPIVAGTHIVACPMKCSVEVYGWSQAVSYLFAGGLDLKPLVLE
jgi:hypothetical protein